MKQDINEELIPPPTRRGLGGGDKIYFPPISRRTFLTALITSPLLALLSAIPVQAEPKQKRIFIQRSYIAGFKYYDGTSVWPHLANGQSLNLKREPHNPYDHRAVAVYWQGHKVGFVPHHENRVVAQMLDNGQSLGATITWLGKGSNLWKPWVFDVEVVV